MIGFPDETMEDINETFELMKELDVDICFSVFTPYPGTPLFELAKRYDLIPPKPDWSLFSHQSLSNSFIKSIKKSLACQMGLRGCVAMLKVALFARDSGTSAGMTDY